MDADMNRVGALYGINEDCGGAPDPAAHVAFGFCSHYILPPHADVFLRVNEGGASGDV
jgi:hypothetical protein